ncbi:transposase family protein [Streptomyces sp. WAC07061]|uniref:transposase family protein n=1 Tax=Streptomyces sp. WAC07061 TaxID=2487410 RepID=UPI0021B04EBC|nr:transposase family protein [Streptomyces sp. WAC07061]
MARDPIFRKADRRNYSGKHRSHGRHFLALTDEKGRLIWISAARPGRTHDNTAARHDHILAHLRATGLGALADLGFRGLDNDILDPVIVTGCIAARTHKLTRGEKEANRVLAMGRAPVEHGFAHLKNWRILTKLRTDPARATRLRAGAFFGAGPGGGKAAGAGTGPPEGETAEEDRADGGRCATQPRACSAPAPAAGHCCPGHPGGSAPPAVITHTPSPEHLTTATGTMRGPTALPLT